MTRGESYQADLKAHLQSYGIWEDVSEGKCQCSTCKQQVNLDNFGMFFLDESGYSVTCNSLDCIRTVTITNPSTK